MNIKEVKGFVNVVNLVQSRVVSDAFSLAHDSSVVVNTMRMPESVLDDLQYFYDNNIVDLVQIDKEDKSSNSSSILNVSREFSEHTVFNPEDSIAIKVESIDINTKGIELKANLFDREQATDFLALHWKTLEKEVALIDDKEKLRYLISVAHEMGMEGNKKYSIIEKRYTEL